MSIYGNAVGGSGLERTYILVDENGVEAVAVMSDNDTVLDATANDVRLGKTVATASGVIIGEKEIPAYYVTEGWSAVPTGSDFRIRIVLKNRYDFTKLQAILCPFNTSVAESVSAEKVVIEKNVYEPMSTESVSEVTVDHENKTIELGISNESDKPFIIRYLTYKEEH